MLRQDLEAVGVVVAVDAASATRADCSSHPPPCCSCCIFCCRCQAVPSALQSPNHTRCPPPIAAPLAPARCAARSPRRCQPPGVLPTLPFVFSFRCSHTPLLSQILAPPLADLLSLTWAACRCPPAGATLVCNALPRRHPLGRRLPRLLPPWPACHRWGTAKPHLTLNFVSCVACG